MLSPDTYLAALQRDAALLADVARRGIHPPVPNCPGWIVADLVEHTGIVHRHKLQILEEQWLEGSPDPRRPPPRRRLIPWFEEGARLLHDALAALDPHQTISTWDSNNETVGFWHRRMAHETFVHRIDGEQAHRVDSSLDRELAADGVAELLDSFLGGAPSWATVVPTDERVVLEATDGDERWHVRIGRFHGTSTTTGIEYRDELIALVETDGDADATTARVLGPAATIDLWLWGRASLSDLTVEGHRPAAERLRELAADSTT